MLSVCKRSDQVDACIDDLVVVVMVAAVGWMEMVELLPLGADEWSFMTVGSG